MKLCIVIFFAALTVTINVYGQNSGGFSPSDDAYMVTTGGGTGYSAFYKIPISNPFSQCYIIEAILRVYVIEIGSSWDGNVQFIHYTNQNWTQDDSTQHVWNSVFWGDTIIQDTLFFGDSLGHTYSVDLAQFMNTDIKAGNEFCSIRISHPDDPTTSPQQNEPLVNDYYNLFIGLSPDNYLILQPREWGLTIQRPIFLITYTYRPIIDQIIGSGTFCVDDPISLSAEVSGDGPFTFQWQKDGADISGATDSVFVVNSLSTSDAGLYRLIASNPWVSDTSGVTDVIVNICNQIENSDYENIKIYPNPGKDKIYIDGIKNKSIIELYSIEGKKIFETMTDQSSICIDLTFAKDGIHTLKIISQSDFFEKSIIIAK